MCAALGAVSFEGNCVYLDSLLIVLHLRRGKVVMVIKVDVFQKKKVDVFLN